MLPTFVGVRDANLVPILPKKVSVSRDIWIGVHEDQGHIRRISAISKYVTSLIEADQPFLKTGELRLERPVVRARDFGHAVSAAI